MNRLLAFLISLSISISAYAGTEPQPIADCWHGYIHIYIFKVSRGWLLTNNMGGLSYIQSHEDKELGFCEV